MFAKNNYSKPQLSFLLVLRFLVGWHILYEGMSKVFNPQWSSLRFLQESQWILSGFSKWIISNAQVLLVVDFLNTWGLVAIGLGIILGFLFKPAAISGALLLFTYYLNAPPLIGFEYSLPADGSNLIVNKTLIEAIVLIGLSLFPTNKTYGLDYFTCYMLKNKKK
ncbi:MAG: DoxX family membrane protein [Sulfurimonas sp.]|jgi:thiosulfate dehydrogenase [quinone] large subunit|nr:DoxX family membrane protein [Sulfurimonas sp.]